MKLLKTVRNNSYIFIFTLSFFLLILIFNVDLIYKNLYNIGFYDGKLNNVTFTLENQWYLCESTEEGIFSLFKFDFPMVTYCDGKNGKIQFFPWLEKYNNMGKIKTFNDIELTFLRYVESDDKVMFLHKKSMFVILATPSNSIEYIVNIN